MAEPFLNVASSITGRTWVDRLGDAETRVAQAISQRNGDISEILARVLAGRGVGIEQAALYLNPTIRDLIMKAEDKKLSDAIRIGFLEGMLDFNESLRQLVERGDVDRATALEVATNPEALKMAFKGIKIAQPGIL